jgi:hypothetical protein
MINNGPFCGGCAWFASEPDQEKTWGPYRRCVCPIPMVVEINTVHRVMATNDATKCKCYRGKKP